LIDSALFHRDEAFRIDKRLVNLLEFLPMSVLAAIAVLAILIVVHELGHFLAARSQGIYANRFSIGFGPVLWKYQGPQTEYALRAFPLGGFVGFPDDDPEANGIDPKDPNLLKNRPILDRAIVISAGVIANLLFAYLVLAAQLGVVGIPVGFNYNPGVVVTQVVAPDSAAAQAGLKAEDIVIAVNNRELGASEMATAALKETIEASPNQPLQLKVQRASETIDVTVTPRPDASGKGRIGIALSSNISSRIYERPKSVWEIFSLAAEEFQRIVTLTVKGFGLLLTNFGQVANQVAGPVKIVEEGARLANSDAPSLFAFAALISINLAVINILPLPALDGGHLAFLLIEGLRGKPLPSRIQDGVMQTGLMLLLGLGIFLIVRDTSQLEPIKRLIGG
jgi:membrane-associated protease RseP (regulator of RpoE activity)